MSFKKTCWCFSAILIAMPLLREPPVLSAREVFPFVAKIEQDHVNVRAGDNENYEPLCQLEKDDQVIVLEKRYAWYKIELPRDAKSFVAADFIRLIGPQSGVVTADRVNVRARPHTGAAVLNQLSSGFEVEIIEQLDGWYQIVPTAQTYGWVREGLLTFVNTQVQQVRAKQIQEARKEPTIESQISSTEHSAAVRTMSCSGVLLASDPEAPSRYRIIQDQDVQCYINGFEHLLSDFLDRTVSAEGSVILETEQMPRVPVLDVRKIQLIL